MSKMFEPGTRVSELVKNRRSTPRKGKVLNESLDDPGLLLVEWDKRPYYEKKNPIVKIEPSKLMLEEEADAKATEYELAFGRLEQEVAGKIRDAATLIEEASKIASANGESLDQLHDVTGPLVHAMDAAGWNTSSWGC